MPKVITSLEAAQRSAKDESGRRVFAVREPVAASTEAQKLLSTLTEISKKLDAKPGNDEALRALTDGLVKQVQLFGDAVNAQQLAIHVLLRRIGNNVTVEVTSRDEDDRIQTLKLTRGQP